MAYRKIFLVKLTVLLFLLVTLLFPLPLRAAEESSQVYFLHALKSKKEGRFLAAERLFRKAIEIKPENADYHFELGNLYIEQNNPERAQSELEQALMISPQHLPAHYNLGLVYRDLGNMSEAREEFRRVLDLDPKNVKAQLQLGYTYQDEGFPDEARQAFETAQEMDITNTEPRQALEDLAGHEMEMERRRAKRQSSNRDALMQAGGVLLEQLARRSENQNEPNSPS